MLDRGEHRRELSDLRERRGRALGGHRDELNAFRNARSAARAAGPGLHRRALDGERRAMREVRQLHRRMLAENRWLVALAERLQRRLEKAG
jgi:hypothetical protein